MLAKPETESLAVPWIRTVTGRLFGDQIVKGFAVKLMVGAVLSIWIVKFLIVSMFPARSVERY